MYWTGSHTKHWLKYYLVWIPKYRKRMMRGVLALRIEALIRQCAEVNEWNIEELNIQLDHVHMLVRLKPDISVSKAVQLMKGGSSKILREEMPEIEEFLWGESFWANGYFAESVGICAEAAIKAYMKNQNP